MQTFFVDDLAPEGFNDVAFLTRSGSARLSYDRAAQTARIDMTPPERGCFSLPLLFAMRAAQAQIKALDTLGGGVAYLVLASTNPAIFNRGGDLDMFRHCVATGNRRQLVDYARTCIDLVYDNYRGYESDVLSVALVRGQALGGGFEAALACDVIIAEEGAQFGFPEVVFNLFPGMGAVSFLARRLDAPTRSALLYGGRLFTARQMHEIGLVDEVVPDGEAEQALAHFLAGHRRRHNSDVAIRRSLKRAQGPRREELDDIVATWVDTALKLTARELSLMDRLVKRQDASAASVCSGGEAQARSATA